MARRSSYQAVGFFAERFGFQSDVDMWMRLAEDSCVAYVDEPLITLPSRDAAPRLVSLKSTEEARKVRKMFWEARMRHYRDRPFRRAFEAGRHAVFAVRAIAVERALTARRSLRSRNKSGPRDA
jgi:hypothetical protein